MGLTISSTDWYNIDCSLGFGTFRVTLASTNLGIRKVVIEGMACQLPSTQILAVKNKPERGFGFQVRDGDFIEFEFKTRH